MNYFVKPEVLESVRKKYGIPPAKFAEKVGVELAVVTAWEQSGANLSTAKMQSIADVIYCHWSVLLRDDPLPAVEQPKSRRVSQHRDGFVPDTKTLISYRESNRLLDHITQSDIPKAQDGIRTLISDVSDGLDFDKAAATFRELVGYSEKMRSKLSDPRRVYAYLVGQLEKHGIFVSEQEFETDDIRGFLISKDDTYLIVISSLDRYPASKLFTLLHETGHILRGKSSSACDLHENYKSTALVELEERYCNSFAAGVLLPREELLNDRRVIQLAKDVTRIDNDVLNRIASTYRTSYLAVVRRLFTLGVINFTQYRLKTKEFYDDILPLIMAKMRRPEGSEVRLPKAYHVNKEIKKSSRAFTEFVIDRYGAGVISSGEAKKLLGVDTKYLVDIQNMVGAGN